MAAQVGDHSFDTNGTNDVNDLHSSICALTLVIILAVWEQVSESITPGAVDVCLPWRLHVFRGTTSFLVSMVLMHLGFLLFMTTPVQKSLGEAVKDSVNMNRISPE